MTGRTTSDTDVEAVSLVPVPVTVRVYVPGTVVSELVIITRLAAPELIALGWKVALTPLGRPLIERFNGWAAPEVTADDSVKVLDVPAMFPTAELTPSEKRLGGARVKASVVVAVSLLPVPVIVRGYVPGTAAVVLARVTVLIPPELIALGRKLAVTPLGRPLIERFSG